MVMRRGHRDRCANPSGCASAGSALRRPYVSEQPKPVATDDLGDDVGRVTAAEQAGGDVPELQCSFESMEVAVGNRCGRYPRCGNRPLGREEILEERRWLILTEIGADRDVLRAHHIDEVLDRVEIHIERRCEPVREEHGMRVGTDHPPP